MATIHAISVALPAHSISAEESGARLGEVFAELGEDPELVRQVVSNSGIERRYLARPPGFYLSERGLTARNGAYAEVAKRIGVDAARAALQDAGVRPDEVDLIVDTSCTGLMIPALDVFVANALGFRPDVRRVPLTEAGCAAGATALALAADLLAGQPARVALVLCVELPSLTLQLEDPSRANLVSSAIFGDGAAAVVVSGRTPRGPGLEHLAHKAVLFPETTDLMGFDLRTEGLKIVLSARIPALVRKRLRPEVDAFLEAQGLSVSDLGFFVLHPGGTKVLDNVRDALGLDEEQVTASRQVLREYGNLSSASVHFVAKALLESGGIEPGALGLLCAMGPGFTVELALLRGVAPGAPL